MSALRLAGRSSARTPDPRGPALRSYLAPGSASAESPGPLPIWWPGTPPPARDSLAGDESAIFATARLYRHQKGGEKTVPPSLPYRSLHSGSVPPGTGSGVPGSLQTARRVRKLPAGVQLIVCDVVCVYMCGGVGV